MKDLKIFILITLVAMMLFFSSCITCCPEKDVYIKVFTPMGFMPVKIPKGYLDKENHGESWLFADEVEGK